MAHKRDCLYNRDRKYCILEGAAMMLVSGRVCEVFFTSNPSAYRCHSLRGCVILSVVVNLRFAFSDVYSVFRVKGVFLAFLWSFRRRKTAGSLQLGETGFNCFYWRNKKNAKFIVLCRQCHVFQQYGPVFDIFVPCPNICLFGCAIFFCSPVKYIVGNVPIMQFTYAV